MNSIKSFKELNIKAPDIKSFQGEKVKFKNLVGKQIVVHDFKIEPSKFEGDRLDIQISLNNEKRITWTQSKYILASIESVPKEAFPFSTIIMQEDERFQFT